MTTGGRRKQGSAHLETLTWGPHSGREAPVFVWKQVIRTTDIGRTLVYDSRGPELSLKPLTGQVLWQTSMISAPENSGQEDWEFKVIQLHVSINE